MEKKVKGMDYFGLALYAFGGLGLELVLGFWIEPFIYGGPMNEWGTWQCIIHWTLTCILWGLVAKWVIKEAKQKYGFDLFEKTEQLRPWQWGAIGGAIIFALAITYWDWQGFKVVEEFVRKGMVKGVFQYIYYLFETVLICLIIIFGQKACEVWFKKTMIPYGGIICALTWGLGHILSKGSIFAGLFTAVGGFLFGSVYLLVNRKAKLTFIIVFIMFAF